MQQYPLLKLLFSSTIISLFKVIIILDLFWTEQSSHPRECCAPQIPSACTFQVKRGCWCRSQWLYHRHRSRSSNNSLLTFSKLWGPGENKNIMDVRTWLDNCNVMHLWLRQNKLLGILPRLLPAWQSEECRELFLEFPESNWKSGDPKTFLCMFPEV